MSDGDNLLRAILDEPADDLHRLAYADWLDDAGDDARAEFIRAHIAITANPGPESLARMQATGETWRNMLPEGVPCAPWHNHEQEQRLTASVIGVRFSRGFVERVTCPLQMWLKHGATLVRTQPIGEVMASDKYPDLEDGQAVWRRTTEASPESSLPVAVYRRLNRWTQPTGQDITYPDIPTALDALSTALLAAVKPQPAETHYASTIVAQSAFTRRFLHGTEPG